MFKEYPPILLKSKELIEAWRKTLQAFDEFTEQSIKGCFFHIKMKVMLRILNHLTEENKLSKYDERIFEYFDHLMHHYQRTIYLFYDNEENIKTGKAKEILIGICTVLLSQLKQFKESQLANQGIADPKANINPIKIEKDKFVTEQKINILNQLDELEKLWLNYKIGPTLINSRNRLMDIYKGEDSQLEFIRELYLLLIEEMSEPLYKCYTKRSEKGIKRLNDFHLRKAANFYYESIKQEKDNVEAIIKIQVNALEEEMKIEQYESSEQQIIQEILHTIREAYQHLGKEIEELEDFFKEAEKEPNKIILLDKEGFENYLKFQGMRLYINDITVRKKLRLKTEEPLEFIDNFNDFTEKWGSLKEELLKIYIEKFNPGALLKEIVENLYINKEAGERIVDFFLEFNKNQELYKDIPEEAEYTPIIEGISETISIKIESLRESLELYQSTINQFEEYVKKELDPIVIEKEYEKIDLEIYNKFISKYDTPIEDVLTQKGAFLDNEIKEGYDALMERLGRKVEKIKNEANKKMIKYLREHLFFEMSTYEEIINYSVSRLRNENEEVVASYVENIDALTLKLENLLEEFKVEFINPKTHEKFNGKEHEVLMAEVKEGFEKGEIIKTMNRGYKYNNQIVLKANVVAGK
ncbi:MAG: nucleotide exchange factor GrpE [Epulopiscium sp.]|nr:nucleotide exchange factor GrpE [Candidatus Epulonipiscium sp.]